MQQKLTYFLLPIFLYWTSICGTLADSELSATPDYSYDSYKNRQTYSLNPSMSYSSSHLVNNNASSRTFSNNIMMVRNRPDTGFSPQSVNSTNNYKAQQTSTNSAYYRTNPYKY